MILVILVHSQRSFIETTVIESHLQHTSGSTGLANPKRPWGSSKTADSNRRAHSIESHELREIYSGNTSLSSRTVLDSDVDTPKDDGNELDYGLVSTRAVVV